MFDYLTLGQQPYEDREPMDSVHMQHLYDRLESYSVELMLKKIERVQKLSDEVLSVETDLLEVSFFSVQNISKLLKIFLIISTLDNTLHFHLNCIGA